MRYGAVVHLSEHFWKGSFHLFTVTINLLYESLADTLQTRSVHWQIHHCRIQLYRSVTRLSGLGAFPFHGTLLRLTVVGSNNRIQPTSLIVVDDEVWGLWCRILSRLAERTKASCLPFKVLLVGWLYEVSQVDVSEAVYYWMKEHCVRFYILKWTAGDAPSFFSLSSLRRF